jgi:iron complex outermembrane receptor protein
MNFLKVIAFLACFSIGYAYGDDPTEEPIDTIALEQVEITANRLVNFTTGYKVNSITTVIKDEYNSSNLSELLAQITPISIKSYGIAGQSNIALRGMHSKHTAILWNGINLQNTMNSGFNMNSVPSFFIDNISIQHGGSGALFGSGAVGGVVHINNNLNFNKNTEISLQQGYSSFTNVFEGVKINYSTDKFANSTKVFYKYGKNDFEFINTQEFGNPKRKQENSVSEQYGILQSNLFRVNKKQKISTNIWAQKNYLEIPPMITSSSSQQNQNTEFLRIASAWNRNGAISSWYSRLYYNYESLIYGDADISLVSEMNHFSVVGEVENKVSLNENFLLNIGINNTFEKVMTKNYGIDRSRNRTSAFSSIKFYSTNKKITAIASVREEIVDNEGTPLTYSLSSNYQVLKILRVYGNISKTYNLPSFNDLYWVPGGNDTLKAENGWSWDIGNEFNFKTNHNSISFDITYFNVNLNNHIIWLPDNTGNWSANNVEELWSRGIETSLRYKFIFRKISTGFNFNYTYTRSTYEGSDSVENTNGKQLIYIPEHKAYAGFYFTFKDAYLRLNNNYVSERYTSKNNSTSIDSYFLTDLAIGYNYKFKLSRINASFKIHNLFNKTYEVMAFYAMPLRYYSFNLTYTFKKPNI